ncbi:MAG: hypothetical protein ACK5II_03395 [Paracoccus sp. (in: a-proteobacteria)]
MVDERFVYRGETFWHRWDHYFANRHGAKWFKDYELDAAHDLNPGDLPDDYQYCGFWVWKHLSGGVQFCMKEPILVQPAQRRRRAFQSLDRQQFHHGSMRILVRIDAGYLSGFRLIPDRMLIAEHESAAVYLTNTVRGNEELRETHSRSVTLPDHAVDIYFRGHWHRKSPDLGIWLKNQLTSPDKLKGFSDGLEDL